MNQTRVESGIEVFANYASGFLLKQIEIPFIPFCTDEERKQAEKDGAELVKFFNQLHTGEDR